MKIWAIAQSGLKESLRRRIVYCVFLISLLFIIMAKGCDMGTFRGDSLLGDKDMRQSLTLSITFHGIAFWSIMLCGLLAAQALTREIEDGTALLTLARPLSRDSFIAGKLLAALVIAVFNLLLLCGVALWFYYRSTGSFNARLPLACLFMTLSMALYGLMTCTLSLFIPRLLAPLAGCIIYIMSCWSALPYYVENLKLLWKPSGNVARIHTLFPRFGDLQFIGSSILNGQAPELADPGLAAANILIYAVLFWCITAACFKRREL